MVRKEAILRLETTIIAKDIIKGGFNSFKRRAIVWSGRKDNLVVLDLVSKCRGGFIFKLLEVLFIDHGDHYPETLEIISNIDKIVK